MLSVCSAIEPLRMANILAKKELYTWSFLGDKLQAPCSTIGIPLQVDDVLPTINRDDIVFVCAGENVMSGTTKPLLNWVRKCARLGADLGGLCTGAYVLAKAGLLKDKHATVHWNNQSSLEEMFPETMVMRTPIQIDGRRMTTSGGVSSIDLMLELIRKHHSERLSNQVAEQLMYTKIRMVQETTVISAADRKPTLHPRVRRVIRLMEDNLDQPLSGAKLADCANVSSRQLERLFRKYFDQSPARYYKDLRLQRALDLLLRTELSLIDISITCGFGSASSFSKNFQKKYSISPSQMRLKHLAY